MLYKHKLISDDSDRREESDLGTNPRWAGGEGDLGRSSRVPSYSAPPGAGPAAGLRQGAGLCSGSHPSLHQCPAVAAPRLSRIPGGSR